MKFLCDHMLVRVGRWLRAAGYDTEIVEGKESDRHIFEKALAEQRLLITRDKYFTKLQEGKEWVIWLEENSVEDCLKKLSKKVPIDWTMDPFSRCLLCNQKFFKANREEMKMAPESLLAQNKEFWICKHCNKLYWLGSHTNHMLEKLKRINDF